MRNRGVPFVLALALTVASCAKPRAGAPDAADDAAVAAKGGRADDGGAANAPIQDEPRASRDAGAPLEVPTEARRTRGAALSRNPALAANADLIRKHFDGAVPTALLVQTAELSVAGRRALLVADGSRAPAESRPLLLVVDDRGALLWSRERPTAGITPPAGAFAIAPGPEGRVALVVCDPPTLSLAARIVDDDGSPFADFQALEIDGCEDLSVLYWPRHGWIMAVARTGTLRAQLLTESGALGWGKGVTMGVAWRAAAPATLVIDTPDSFMLLQYGFPASGGASDHALASRYDAHAAAMWAGPVDLGTVPRVPAAAARLVATRPREGVVGTTVNGGAAVEIRSAGNVHLP